MTSRYLTTADVARWLGCSTRAVRWMAHTGQLAGERTQSGQRFFHRQDVKHLADRRGDARCRGVRVLRPKLFGVRSEPQQLSLFWMTRPRMAKAKAPLRFVARPELMTACGSTPRAIARKTAGV